MNRQNVDGVDRRESPALASSPHHSPRPRVARRGGAHAPPRACLRGSPAQTIAVLRLIVRASFGVARTEVVRASFGVAETEGDQHLALLTAEATLSLRRPS